MTHDPYQTHATVGAYSGLTNPFSSPYGAMQTSGINPALACNPLAGQGLYGGLGQQMGIPAYGPTSPVFGLSPFTSAWQNPFISAYQNPFTSAYQNPFTALQNPFTALQNPFTALQNPLVSAIQREIVQNQLAAAVQQNPLIAAQLASQFGFGQQYQQPGISPFYSFPHVGQAGWGMAQHQQSPFSQFNNPLAQSSLAPQTWVGQGQQGQIHPLLLQAVARGIQPNQGISPWGTF